MRVQPVHVSFSAAAAVALLLSSISSPSPAPSSAQEAIDVAISPEQATGARVEAANAVTEGWRDSLPLLLQNIDAYYQSGESGPYAEDAAAKLVPLTDLLVRIIINQDGSVQKFREIDTEKTIDLLAAAAGGTERDLRFNASYILAKTVDDDNLCVITSPAPGSNPRLRRTGQFASDRDFRDEQCLAAERSSRTGDCKLAQDEDRGKSRGSRPSSGSDLELQKGRGDAASSK